MSGIERLEELFAARAEAHGDLSPAFADDDSLTVSAADGTPVNFHYRAAVDAVVVWTVADEAADDDEARFAAALAANRYGEGTRGLTLALAPEALGFGRRLVVQDRRDAAFFDSVETLDAYIEDFAAVARQYGADADGSGDSAFGHIEA